MSPKAASKARLWTILAVFISVIIIVVGVLLAAKPLLDNAADSNSQAEDQESRNDQAQAEVNRLKAQFAQLDDYKGLLNELRVQVPTTLETQEFQRQFAAMADERNVEVTSVSFATATKVTVTNAEVESAAVAKGAEAVSKPQADPPADTTADTATAGEETTPTATSQEETNASKPAFSDFYVVPVSIDVQGSYSDVLALVRTLQMSEQRILLISGLSGSGGSGAGTGDSEAGQLALTIEGQLSVLVDPEAATTATDDENIEKEELPTTKGEGSPMTGTN
ncbi:hypothetical protein GCM10010401_22550 [Rarobacter faecitabidus]|uniref:Tfp pilus assembly protein PilO n=1 Tax=Rarobacter faecitabidus TaxID=13243 RepID=A0A542ZVR1_RARFA|nr:hypothetical protein [Rarobacter faecitabidus]TQL64457.1 hypothetical protein FB461_0961 [Rarobacter faecitabidus]